MHISKLNLVNYRNFLNETFLFDKGVNTVIGENGSGKSNLFRAMRLMLDPNYLRSAYSLQEKDFHRGLGNWRGHWIIIHVEFSNIDDSESVLSLLRHGGLVLGEEDSKVATYNLIFRPKAHIRKKLSDTSAGDIQTLSEIRKSITIDDYETVFTGRSHANFNDPSIYKEIVGDFEKVIFPSQINQQQAGINVPLQLSIAKEVSFNFIKALRDVVAEFNNKKTNPLLYLLKIKSEYIKKANYTDIISGISLLNEKIEALDDVNEVRENIIETLTEAVGESYSPKCMTIKSDLPEDAENLLKSLILFIGESDESYAGDINELSLGGANLIYIALKILEFKYRKKKKETANFLIIEEPEAHIHTHIQRTLFENVDYDDTQIIYSTHSTQISEVSNIKRVNILAKAEKKCCSFQPANGLTNKEQIHLQRYLDATRSSLLFAKGVILVEGDAEEILIPLLVKKVLGISLDEMAISIINIGSTGFKNVANIFHTSRIRRNCSIITDLDTAIGDIEINEDDTEELIKYKTKMKNSESSGLQRKAIIDTYTEQNEFVKPFYAKHTFEVDFISENNFIEIIKTVNETYKRNSLRIEAKSDLKAENGVEVYGKRVLEMAEKNGKGWFAILLGDYINEFTYIPQYILDAIFFSKGLITKSLSLKIINHRIDAYLKYYEEADNEEDENEDLIKAKALISGYINNEMSFADFRNELYAVSFEPLVNYILGYTDVD